VLFRSPTRNFKKRNIVGRDLNLPQAFWKGGLEKASGFQTI
jgi:hypothetical protein